MTQTFFRAVIPLEDLNWINQTFTEASGLTGPITDILAFPLAP